VLRRRACRRAPPEMIRAAKNDLHCGLTKLPPAIESGFLCFDGSPVVAGVRSLTERGNTRRS